MIFAPFFTACSASRRVFLRFSSGFGRTLACKRPILTSRGFSPFFISPLNCDRSTLRRQSRGLFHYIRASLGLRRFRHWRLGEQVAHEAPERLVGRPIPLVIN